MNILRYWMNSRRRRLAGVLGVTLLIIFVVLSARSVVATYFYERALRVVSQEGSLEKVEHTIEWAIFFSEKDLYYRALSDVGIAKLKLLIVQAGQSEEVVQEQFESFFSEAQQAAKRATELNEYSALNWMQLGKVYASIVPFNIDGAYVQALQSYAKARILDSKNPLIPLRIAELAVAHNDLSKALTEINAALGIKEDYADALILKAQIQIKQGDRDGAIHTTKDAMSMVPDSPSLYLQLGTLYYAAREHAAAVQALERAISLSPEYANAHYFLGLVYYELGRNTDALQQFEIILKEDPNNIDVAHIISNLKNGAEPFETD